MRRKIFLGIAIFILLAITAHFLGISAIVGATIIFGLGFLLGRRQAHR
jgi:hypothetical protein